MQCPSPLPINIQHLEKEARDLLYGIRRRDAAAIARWYSLDPLADSHQPRLADAQYTVARKYGFSSWRNLRNQLKVISPTNS